MKILYEKSFSKDLDKIQHDKITKRRLLELIEKIKKEGSLESFKNTKKLEGYQNYYRIRIGDYRLGLKITDEGITLIRFLHRKEIYRKFP